MNFYRFAESLLMAVLGIGISIATYNINEVSPLFGLIIIMLGFVGIIMTAVYLATLDTRDDT